MTRLLADLDVPRSNGELVFSAPWESRAFGMAVALHEQGAYDWDAFRDRLVAEIGANDPDAMQFLGKAAPAGAVPAPAQKSAPIPPVAPPRPSSAS